MTQQPRKKKRRKPLGPVLKQSDADLEALATITPADLLAAQVLWQTEAPEELRKLLEAKVEEQKSEQSS